MTYEQFMLDFWREIKRMAVEPLLSVGELAGLLAYLAFKPPWWVSTPLLLIWIIWRNRDSDSHAIALRRETGAARKGGRA